VRVLIACEFSGVVREAFRARGHEAWSCDLLPTELPGLHYTGDVRDILDGWMPVQFQSACDPHGDGWCSVTDGDPNECPCPGPTDDRMEYRETAAGLFARPVARPGWDLMVAHPPCTYLTLAGLHWNNRIPGRREKTDESLRFVRDLLAAPVPKIALENPVGCISTHICKPDQIVQPWQFGHPESKQTCFWLRGLPKLQPTEVLEPTRFQLNGRPRWDNQTPTGQNRLGPSPDRWKKRSKTCQGIADAMAEQWGALN